MKAFLRQSVSSLAVLAAICASSVPGWAAKAASKEKAVTQTADSADLKWGPAPAFMPKGTELAVLHGDPSKKNSDVFLRIQPKGHIPNHWHTSAERMILVRGELRVTYEGQEAAFMKAGSYAYGPAKHKHDAVCESSTPCVLFIAFEGPVDAHPSEK